MTTPTQGQEITPLQRAAVSRKLVEAEIISRAWSDDAFRKKLENDPVAALAEAGIPLPKDKNLRVIHETPNTLTLVIPSSPAHEEAASDEELEAVAGGGMMDTYSCQLYDHLRREKKRDNKFEVVKGSVVAAVSSLIGYSWGWGDRLPRI